METKGSTKFKPGDRIKWVRNDGGDSDTGAASSLDLQDYIEFVADLESHLGVSYGETLYDTVLRHVTFDRIAELKDAAAERDRLRALNAKLVAACKSARYALRHPLDGWRGDVDRTALDAIAAALAESEEVAP